MSTPKVIGEGTYGCVHKPSLKCKNKPKINNSNIVSKLMTDAYASEELNEFKVIKKADKKENFHLGKPKSCKVENNIDNHLAIRNCSGFNPDLIDNYSLLLLKDGGDDLRKFSKQIKELSSNDANTRMVEHFWLEVSRILFGIKTLHDNENIHHDLKHQNIVYNKDKKRINFIDFGLMTTKSKIIKDAKNSNYDFAINHWSFPIEMKLYNKRTFNEVIQFNSKKLKNYITDNLYDITEYHSHFFECILEINDRQSSKYKNKVNMFFNNYYQMISNLSSNQYDLFLDKSIETIDTYGTATGLLYVLKNCKKHITDELYKDLKGLFLNMVNFNVFIRDSPEVVVSKYENILLKHDLLKKYNMKFVDHILTPGSQPTLIDKPITFKQQTNFLDSIIIQCPEGKELNPTTKRCNKTCKIDYKRNSNFKCTRYRCPTGKDLNTRTKRCNKTCKKGYKRNSEFKCVKDK